MNRAHGDMRRVVRRCRDLGWEVSRTRRGHWRVRIGSASVFTSGTPSDVRAMTNFIAQLRRAGFTWEDDGR